MNSYYLGSAVALSLLLAACGENRTAATNTQAESESGPEASQPAEVHSAAGTIQSVVGDQVTIAHGPVASLGWPAMTMTFTAPDGMASAARAGSSVDFSFRQAGSTYVLASLTPR